LAIPPLLHSSLAKKIKNFFGGAKWLGKGLVETEEITLVAGDLVQGGTDTDNLLSCGANDYSIQDENYPLL